MTLSVSVEFPSRVTGYRGLYRAEGGNTHEWNQPAVIPNQFNGVKDSFGIPFTEDMQWLSWSLARHYNFLMTRMNWASVWAGDTWATNKNGWDNEKDPTDYRRDYVNDRYDGYGLPKVMDGIVFAGGLYNLQPRDGHLWATPGVSGIDCNKPMPSMEEVIERRWFMRCTINGNNGPYDFAQGKGLPVYVPYFLTKEIPYTASHFKRWDSGSLTPPFRFYL
jgi:hypothetical protein